MKKRRWSTEEKARIVEATLAAGASVARVAQDHGVRASQVYQWRKQCGGGAEKRLARSRRTAKLMPVTLAEERAGRSTEIILSARTIEIELPKGRMRIVGADAALLRAAVEMLQ